MSSLFTLFSLLLFLLSSSCEPGQTAPPDFSPSPAAEETVKNNGYTWQRFQGARRSSRMIGMPELKKYNDSDTLLQMTSPRCGVRDAMQPMHAAMQAMHYVYFPGKPRWARPIPMTLTYAFSPENLIGYLTLEEIRAAFKSAFSRWASVIPVSFTETDSYRFADIKIGFYSGDHGDGEPFDGPLGVLAHAFSPESGKFHLDAAERWAVDLDSEKSTAAIHLESVATHEIGHLLGLAHSPVKDSVMYPSLKPRAKKTDLQLDDIEAVQALYGSNPNFKFTSSMESDISSNQGIDFRVFSYRKWSVLLSIFSTIFIHVISK